MRHYVKQIEQGDAGDFSKMNNEELDEFIASHMRQGEAAALWVSRPVLLGLGDIVVEGLRGRDGLDLVKEIGLGTAVS
jgi:hypothetical protein